MLSELVRLIFVTRSQSTTDGSERCLQIDSPLRILKTEISFNGTYWRRDKIGSINSWSPREAIGSDKYKQIDLAEIRDADPEGFFGYIFEEMSMFDNSRRQSLEAIKKHLDMKWSKAATRADEIHLPAE